MNGNKKSNIGLTFAWNGIKQAFIHERNFRIHFIMMFIVFISGIIFRISVLEWLIITLIVTIVLSLELVNSVCERMIDYMKPELSEEAKVIKDMAAGAVLVAAIGSIIIGFIIFIPKIIHFFGI